MLFPLNPIHRQVTGATGYLGSWVTKLLLDEGYTVRAAVRPGKTQRLHAIFPNAGSNLEAIEIESLTADLSALLQNTGAVIHCASPSYCKGETGQEIVQGGYHGTLNVVNTAIAAGVKKIVVTSSAVTLFDPDFKGAFMDEIVSEKSFGSTPADHQSIDTTSNPLSVYQAAKGLADKHIWKLQRENPNVDFTVIVPPAIYGPFVANYPLPSDRAGLGSTEFVYSLVTGGPEGPNTYPAVPFGHIIDVRDAAKAHVLALSVPPTVDGQNKRFILSSKTSTWKETAELVRVERPELASRLPHETAVPPAQTCAPLDLTFTKEVLGLKEYLPWQETMLGSLDDAVRWEKDILVKA